jgi:hypothetical protein
VVLATSSTKTAGAGYQGGDMASGSYEELGHQDEVAKGEDIEGMIVSSGMGPPSGKSESKGKDNHMPRYKTRLFAAEYAIQYCHLLLQLIQLDLSIFNTACLLRD